MDYTKDRFSYSLQNIKALPNSLTKVDAQNSDYRNFPFIEYYTCTEVEKQALRDKIKWDGMTIGRIGRISNFIETDTIQDVRTHGHFVQAKPLRLDYQYEDSHVCQAISAELQTGVYFV